MLAVVTFTVLTALVSVSLGDEESLFRVRRDLEDVDQKDSCNATVLVPREFWEAEIVDQNQTGPAKVINVVMTNTRFCNDKESCGQAMSGLQREAFITGLPDINYNFVVGFAGNVYVGRDFNNSISLLSRDAENGTQNGIIIGVFGKQQRSMPPPPRAMVAVMNLIVCGMDNGSIEKDVKIRHVQRPKDPCKGSLGERVQRMITSAYDSSSAYAPIFECMKE